MFIQCSLNSNNFDSTGNHTNLHKEVQRTFCWFFHFSRTRMQRRCATQPYVRSRGSQMTRPPETKIRWTCKCFSNSPILRLKNIKDVFVSDRRQHVFCLVLNARGIWKNFGSFPHCRIHAGQQQNNHAWISHVSPPPSCGILPEYPQSSMGRIGEFFPWGRNYKELTTELLIEFFFTHFVLLDFLVEALAISTTQNFELFVF